MNDFEIKIDEATSSTLNALASANDDPLLLAAIAQIEPHEFRRFLIESGEFKNGEALQLLKAAEALHSSKRKIRPKKQLSDALLTRLKYFIVGSSIGAIIAILFAPKSGQEPRNDIADATREGIDRSREALQKSYPSTQERTAYFYSTASTEAGEGGSLSAAIRAGKKAYLEQKWKAELSGQTEDAPTYKPESSSN